MAEKILVIKWKCECGKKYSTRRIAENHERVCKCWTNPKHKTCKTCKFGKQEWDSNGMEDEPDKLHQWRQWKCGNPKFNYDIHFTPAHKNADDLCINCYCWESKNK